MRQKRPHFSPHSKAKANYKAQISGKLVTTGIRDVAIVSVYTEKTCTKKCLIMIIMITMNKSQEITIFGGRQKLTSAIK